MEICQLLFLFRYVEKKISLLKVRICLDILTDSKRTENWSLRISELRGWY